jgi:thymidylate kinase
VLIALEGIDGAGKSTLADLWAAALRRQGRTVEVLRKRPGLDGETGRLGDLQTLIWGSRADLDEGGDLGARFHLLLHGAWYAGVGQRRLDPALRAGHTIIADGWWTRSAVKASLQPGVSLAWALTLFDQVPVPDRTILLDVSPRLAWARRPEGFTAWETGRLSGVKASEADGFIHYQGSIAEGLRSLARRRHWQVLSPAPSWSPERILDHLDPTDRARDDIPLSGVQTP